MNTPEGKKGEGRDDLSNIKNEPEVPKPDNSRTAYISTCLCCIMVAFGGFVFGWDTGTISGFVNQTDFLRRFGQVNSEGVPYLSKVRMGLIVAIFNVGCAIGGIILSRIGDVYGRRVGLITVVIIYVVGILIQICSFDKWYQYFIGRIISGLAVGMISVICPMFIAESAPKHIRGALVCCYQLMVTLGIFLGYCTCYGTKNYEDSTQWRVPLGLGFAWAIVMFGGMVSMPESPRFLVQHGRLDEARRGLAFVNKLSPEDPGVYAEVESIAGAIEAEEAAGKATWGELVTGRPKIFLRLMTGCFVQSLQQLSGNNYFFYYGTTLFAAVGMNDSFQTSIIFGIVNFASTFVSLWAVEQFGRRINLMAGSIGTVICLVIYASVGVADLYPDGANNPDVTNKPAGNAMIAFACFFIFCFASTWGAVTFVVTSEIYPLRIRGKGMSLAQSCNWLWGFLISFFTPFITGAIHFGFGFVFMGCMVFSIFFTFFIIPETKGLSLEEVDELYESGVPAWKSSGWTPKNNFSQANAYTKAQATQVENAASSSDEA